MELMSCTATLLFIHSQQLAGVSIGGAGGIGPSIIPTDRSLNNKNVMNCKTLLCSIIAQFAARPDGFLTGSLWMHHARGLRFRLYQGPRSAFLLV